MSNQYWIEHPRRTLLLFLTVLAVVSGGFVLAHVLEHEPARNDPAALDQLRSQFAQSSWEPDLVSASWGQHNDLDVTLDRDDRQLAMAACADLSDLVNDRPSTAPGGVTYTYHYDDAVLFIRDKKNNIMVSATPSSNSACRWRLN